MKYKFTKENVLTDLLQTGRITIARMFECMGDDKKYDEEIDIQNKKLNEAKNLQAE